MNRWYSHVARDEGGMTLPELLVATVLAMVITSVVVLASVTLFRSARYSDEDSTALATLRTVESKVTKELRSARRVFSDSTGKKVSFWVDSNRNFLEDEGERITWEVQPAGTKASLVRYTDEPGAVARVEASDLEYADIFAFEGGEDLTSSTRVSVSLRADPEGGLVPNRSLDTKVRMRNSNPDSLYEELDDNGDPCDQTGTGSKCNTGGHVTTPTCGSCRTFH